MALPAAVRARVVRLAAERLGAMPPDEVPVALRAVARFTPARRARLGAAALATALDGDPVLRRQVAEGLGEDLREAVHAGRFLPAVDPVELAVAAYLLRPPHWEAQVERAAGELSASADRAAGVATVDAVQRLTDQLAQVRAASRAELARSREAERTAVAEAAVARRQLRGMGDRAGRAEAAQRTAQAVADQAGRLLETERAAHAAALRGWQDRLAAADRAVEAARSATRGGRQDQELRLRLLLDALVGAAAGLRRELALPPAHSRPADALAGDYPVPDLAAPMQGRLDDDPVLLDGLLAVPTTHLLVDGYNVTKSAYGSVSLQDQRRRLLAGLGGLAARTGAEVTVVFDGAERVLSVAATAPRGVRLLFSRAGETADEVLVRLVRHEPAGRPLVVVSSDREVADGVRRSGARPVASMALVRLLDRSVGGGS